MEEETKKLARKLVLEGPGTLATKEDAYEALTFQVLELRTTGLSIRKIAAELGIATSAVQAHLTRALTEIRSPPLEEVRELELQRLDEMLISIKDRMAMGDVRALELALRIQERRARFLGLDKQGGETILPFGTAFTAALLIQQMKEGAGVVDEATVAPSTSAEMGTAEHQHDWRAGDAEKKRKELDTE